MGHFARSGFAALACALALTGGPAAAAQPPHPQPVAGLGARADALYREAAKATARYEKARHDVRRQRAAAHRLHARVRQGERRLGVLHRQVGVVARSQYRNGVWSPGARLLNSRTPYAFLRRLDVQRQGDHAFSGLLDAARSAQRGLERDRARAQSTLRALERSSARSTAAKRAVEAKLARVQRELRAQQTQSVQVRRTQTGCAKADPPPPPRAGGPRWVTPVDKDDDAYELSAGYASSGSHWSNWHTGQDFAVPEGTPVRAVGDGTVYSAGCGDGFGNQIVVRHDNGYYSQYAHLSLLQAEPGSRVRAGQQIGLSGDTGNSTGPHLHLEIRATPQLGSGIDPVPWLRERGVTL
ncbi:M23 family metallopeptidase [Streptomyces sp. ODS28]|uniref:M23 family metallopeptidase n=1 Tax=Streptomyces sp. ODS28 TaxID=3136688 RepID=UPI0031ED2EE6